MATVTVDGVDLYYETVGDGERIVLTHGAWSDGRGWEAVVDRLSDRFETVIWDRRGHSRSQDEPGPGSCRQDASDLAGLISHLGHEPVHLVGNSAGGSVALNLVTMRPDLVRSAAAHEPGPYSLLAGSEDAHIVSLMERDERNVAHVAKLIEAGQHRQAAEYFVDEVAVGPGAWAQFPAELRSTLVSNAPTVPDDLREAFDADSLDVDALAAAKVPVLITSGAESPELEVAAAEELTRLIPSSRLAMLEGSGHIPHRTHPDEYVKVLTGFIDEVVSNSATGVTAEGSQR